VDTHCRFFKEAQTLRSPSVVAIAFGALTPALWPDLVVV
jgi:hypothetical protein